MVAGESVLTVDEVNQRLPLVRSIVRDIVELNSDITFRRERLQALRERHPAPQSAESVYEQEVQQMELELSRDAERLQSYTAELHQVGAILTDPVAGRVDFPGDLSGERVFFCWQPGESEVQFWHSGLCQETDRISLFHGAGSATDEHQGH